MGGVWTWLHGMHGLRETLSGPSPFVHVTPIFMSYTIIESKAQTMTQFKSTLLDLHALLQVFVISLAHVNNVKSSLNL